MISKKDEVILSVALANEGIASEINSRLITSSASPAAAAALLGIIQDSKAERAKIREILTIALASRKYADEIASQLELIVECLDYQAKDKIANNVALNAAQAKIKPLSKQAREYLVIANANRAMAKRMADAIDSAGAVAAGIVDSIVI